MFKPNALWVTDITQQRTQAGWVYCGVVLDVFARRVVGWSSADHCARSWSSTPWIWPAGEAAPPRDKPWSTPATAANTPAGALGSDSARRGCSAQ
ncbi:DDE-type integrase/transposase/recombinase [Micromonospora sp. NBRC 110038]|uniref:DDE-type integrase/transposase/recombinase n=1 Tax=Micromonospora sp. NBRC 110038 TaxID=1550034 RepID=UPI0035AB8A32